MTSHIPLSSSELLTEYKIKLIEFEYGEPLIE